MMLFTDIFVTVFAAVLGFGLGLLTVAGIILLVAAVVNR